MAFQLKEQKKKHQGGNKWIGTSGTSPFGAYGYNPEGIRIGQETRRHSKAIKVWDKRIFRNFDDTRELDTRGLQVALKRLRQWARIGSEEAGLGINAITSMFVSPAYFQDQLQFPGYQMYQAEESKELQSGLLANKFQSNGVSESIQLNDDLQAIQAYDDLIARYPNSSYAVQARRQIDKIRRR